MNEKTYQRLREELNDLEGYSPEQLDEIRILRGAAALTFAARAKQSGDKVVQHSRQGKEHLSKLKRQESIEDKIDVLSDALDEMFDGLVQTRIQIGNLVGISVASVLISERSTKELTKILNKRR